LILAVTFLLSLSPSLPVGPLAVRFVPNHVAIRDLGVALACLGILLMIWARRHLGQLAGESYGLLVDDHPCNTAIVFVHGFGGNSEKTWWQFQTLPDRLADTWWHFCDFYFYSYDSTGMQIWPNVSALNVFMKRVFPKPDWRNLGAITSGPEKKYTHLVAVAHSEGAVLVRGAVVERAMSYATRSPSTSVFQAELRMFAPAMFGAMICGW